MIDNVIAEIIKEEFDNLKITIEDYKKRNETLEEELFNMKMEAFKESERYHYDYIVEEMKKEKELICCENYHTQNLVEAIRRFGYTKVNDYFYFISMALSKNEVNNPEE